MTPADWCRLIVGLGLVFGLFQWTGSALGSDRGQAGILIAAIVVVATLAVDVLLLGESPHRAARQVGLAFPARRGIIAALTAGVLLLFVIPAYAVVAGVQFAMYRDWWRLTPGLFAQAGVAEETLFRGYLFRHVREGRSFREAVWIAAGPFVLARLSRGRSHSRPWPSPQFCRFRSHASSNWAAILSGRPRSCTPSYRARSSSRFRSKQIRRFRLYGLPPAPSSRSSSF